jgi:hypothetical protein
VIGYDSDEPAHGLALRELLPSEQRVDVLVAPEGLELLGTLRDGIRVLVLPDDEAICDSLSRARLVVGKAGYNQIVESLQLGAPILCRRAAAASRAIGSPTTWRLRPHRRPRAMSCRGACPTWRWLASSRSPRSPKSPCECPIRLPTRRAR